MGGFFGAASKRDVVLDVFFGVDYHSHLGTRRAGLIFVDERDGFQREIHSIENTPFRTRFLHEAEAAGWNTLSGLDMFIAQGDAQFRLWTGRRLPPEAVEAVKAALYGTGQAR